MARHNDVRMYGLIADIPQVVTSKQTGEYVRATFHLAVLKGEREDGNGDKTKLKYDYPFVLTTNKDFIRQIETFEQYDIIEIQGTYTTRKIPKISYCKNCSSENRVDGNIAFVTPIFMKRRNAETLTEKQAMMELKENQHISNNITLVGMLCNDVQYYNKGDIETSSYQIGTGRKFYIDSDDPDVKTDWPVIRTYKAQAKQDSLCLHTGSEVLVEGYLHTKKRERKTKCEMCNEEYIWNDNLTEIIPFAVEYLRDFIDPAEAEKAAAEKADKEASAIMDQLTDG